MPMGYSKSGKKKKYPYTKAGKKAAKKSMKNKKMTYKRKK